MRSFQFSSLVFCVLCASMFTSCNLFKKSGDKIKEAKNTGVQFTSSQTLSDVLDLALAEDKLVFVDFYTTWCLPCKLMDEDVFPDKRLGEFMNENFVSYKVNAEKGNGVNLATLYSINAYPTLLFLDSKGNVLEKKIGAAYQREMFSLGEAALSGMQ